MERSLTIDRTTIDDHSDCYVIAEIGSNHQGSLETCMQLFAEAKAAGASAVKLQKRANRTLFTRAFSEKPYENENSFGATYVSHREALEFDRPQYLELQAYARDLGIGFCGTAFDEPSVEFLADIDMPAYKVASGDLTNLPLLRTIAAVGKPVILSTGGGTLDDVRRAWDEIAAVNPEIAVLQCTAAYPAAPEELDLRVIETYRDAFPGSVIGLSSHENGIAMPVAAFVLGARIVEKHFTLNRAMRGTDHRFSLEPQGLRKLVRDLRRARSALGDGVKRRYDSEAEPLRKMSKGLVAARPLPAGSRLEAQDVAIRSPGDGLPPHQLDEVLGAVLCRELDFEEPITGDALEQLAEPVGGDIRRDGER